MGDTIYLRLRHKVEVMPGSSVRLPEVAQIVAPQALMPSLRGMTVFQVTPEDNQFAVLDAMKVIREIALTFPDADIQTIGPTLTIIEVIKKKRTASTLLFILVWLLLFTGSGLAIMNFHEDVSMMEVHQKIHQMVTGEENRSPLLLQIPYSFGLGLGMILFFNHVFKKRINEEPSPLEVEMFNYQQSLDHYVMMHENKESIRRIDDH
ncbi:MAG TPA: stage V sporulation protein AA [Bacillaceae bacterium]